MVVDRSMVAPEDRVAGQMLAQFVLERLENDTGMPPGPIKELRSSVTMIESSPRQRGALLAALTALRNIPEWIDAIGVTATISEEVLRAKVESFAASNAVEKLKVDLAFHKRLWMEQAHARELQEFVAQRECDLGEAHLSVLISGLLGGDWMYEQPALENLIFKRISTGTPEQKAAMNELFEAAGGQTGPGHLAVRMREVFGVGKRPLLADLEGFCAVLNKHVATYGTIAPMSKSIDAETRLDDFYVSEGISDEEHWCRIGCDDNFLSLQSDTKGRKWRYRFGLDSLESDVYLFPTFEELDALVRNMGGPPRNRLAAMLSKFAARGGSPRGLPRHPLAAMLAYLVVRIALKTNVGVEWSGYDTLLAIAARNDDANDDVHRAIGELTGRSPVPTLQGESPVVKLRQDLRQYMLDACLEYLSEKRASSAAEELPTEDTIERFCSMVAAEAEPSADFRIAVQRGPFAKDASRLTGSPHMPPAMQWPVDNGRPMAFLAQIGFAALPKGHKWPVPDHGWLYVFITPSHTDPYYKHHEDANEGYAFRHVVLYYGGLEDALELRETPPDAWTPANLDSATPFSVETVLSLATPVLTDGSTGSRWDLRFPAMKKFIDLLNGYVDDDDGKPRTPIISYNEDRMFGHRRAGPELPELNRRFRAVATAAGFEHVIELDDWSIETYRQQIVQRAEEKRINGPGSGFPDLLPVEVFAEYKARSPGWLEEATHWGLLLALGSNDHGVMPGQEDSQDPRDHYGFWWGDSFATIQIFVDLRKSVVGDFSNTGLILTNFLR